ncbi:MAG: hypothetical protein HOK61_11575 [Alphaproteobacteria bacterium]|jgi:hypothetical protein|nr:hypothetical protein [Alphaproteobacteria bacterium]
MEFRGRGGPREGDGVYVAASSSPSNRITTTVGGIGDMGVDATVEEVAGGRAIFDSEVVPINAGEEIAPGVQFREYGTVKFGDGDNSISFDTIGSGSFAPAAEPGVLHGGILWSIEGGTGALKGASGIITSNFVIEADGSVTDYHFGVIFTP